MTRCGRSRGLQGDQSYCKVKYGTVTKAACTGATAEKSSYTFEGTYFYMPLNAEAACPGGMKATNGRGEWLKGPKQAVEEIKTPYQVPRP